MDNARDIKEMKGLFEKPEKTKEAILTLIQTIRSNKSFCKLIIYSLNTLKNFLMLSNNLLVIENSITILNENFLDLLDAIVEIHKDNEELMINVGELLFYIINVNNKIEDILYENFIKNKGIDLLMKLLNVIPANQIETYKIYLKIINLILDYKKNKTNDISEFWILTLKLMDKFQNNPDIMLYNLDSLKKFSSLKQFKDLINQEFVDLIIKITAITELNKVATLGLQILDIIIKIGDNKEKMRNTKPLTFIVKLLSKFYNDEILSMQCCSFLSQIIEEEDISSFLNILKIKSIDEVHHETGASIREIKDILSNDKDEETLKILKKNIMRIFILMSKDKGFIQLMKNINTLENFIYLLKSDLTLYDDVQKNNIELCQEFEIIINLLPEFIILVLTILRNYDLSQFFSTLNGNNLLDADNQRDSVLIDEKNSMILMNDIYFCLLKSLYLFFDKIEIVQEILEFLFSNEFTKKYFLEKENIASLNEFRISILNIYKKFHSTRWVFSYLNKFSSYLIDQKNHLLNLLKDIHAKLESYKLIPDQEKMISIIDISFKISLNLMSNVQFDENTFHEFMKTSNSFINLLNKDYEFELLIAFINILLSANENKFFGIIEEKLKLFFTILKKINLNPNSDIKIFSYIIFRIMKISTQKDNKINTNVIQVFMKDESILHLILNLLSEVKLNIKKTEKSVSWENPLKETLLFINMIFSMGDSIQIVIARFLRDNGLIMIIQICSFGIYDFDINKIIIQIIQSLSNKHFKDAIQNFKNYIIFKNFISQIKDLKFSKGINEKIYFEILTFLKNIIKVCDYTEGIEETNLVDHLINEFTEIYFFYLDSNNRIIEIIAEILSIISKEKSLLKSIINSKLPNTLEMILKNLSESSTDDLKIIEFLINIFANFMKSKEYSKIVYTNFRSSLEFIKNIVSHSDLLESCQIKMIHLFQVIIEYENKEVTKDQVLTPIFFKQLLLQIPSNQTNLRTSIDKCVHLIENPYIDRYRKSINQSHLNLIKELNDLSKISKKIRPIDRMTTVKNNSGPKLNLEDDDNILESTMGLAKRKSLICLNDNPDILFKFESIIASINNLVETIEDQYSVYNKDLECEQLCDLMKMLIIFTKEEENLKKIFDSGIIEKIIKIIQNENNTLIFAQDQCYTLLGKFLDSHEYLNYFLENVRISQYFLKLLLNISQKFHKESPQYVKNKYLVACKVISCLSKEKVFLLNNSDINISSILDIISKMVYDRDLIIYILIILNNILFFQLNTIEGEIDFLQQQIYDASNLSKVFQNLWIRFQTEIRIIEKIVKLIETLYLDEVLIKEIIELDFVEFINDLLKNKLLDSDCTTSIFELYDKLMLHRCFTIKLYDQKTMSIFLNTFEDNLFNTKLIEKSSTIILKCCKKEKKFISVMGLFGINEYCIKIMTKYMTTCHLIILKQNLEIIFYLVSDESNLYFFNKQLNMELILKSFLHNIKANEIVLLNLKLVAIITNKDTAVKKQQTQELDVSLIIEIINEVLSNYDERLDIILQLCDLIKNFFKNSKEVWIKKILIDVIFNNSDKYLSKQDFIELFLNTLYDMIKSDKKIIDLSCSSILYYIAKNLNVNLNSDMLLQTLKIFKQISNTKSLDLSSHLNDIMKILKQFENHKSLHNDEIVIFFSKILCNLCLKTSFYKEISNEFIGFTLEYACRDKTSHNTQTKLLENIKNICVFIHIENEKTGTEVANLLTKLYSKNISNTISNKKILINLFQIISALCLQTDFIKSSLLDLKFNKMLKEKINSKLIEDNLLEYQIKGCLLNLKQNIYLEHKKITNASSLTSMSTVIPNVELKDDVREFLRFERKIKFYTEKGEVKDRLIFWNQNLDIIYSAKKNNTPNYEYTDTMNLQDMESCVRSAATNAFKSKGIFSKKPKANRCFSILGVKTFKGQKTFNVECEKEEDCIKYVDYISTVIQNFKSLKEI